MGQRQLLDVADLCDAPFEQTGMGVAVTQSERGERVRSVRQEAFTVKRIMHGSDLRYGRTYAQWAMERQWEEPSYWVWRSYVLHHMRAPEWVDQFLPRLNDGPEATAATVPVSDATASAVRAANIAHAWFQKWGR